MSVCTFAHFPAVACVWTNSLLPLPKNELLILRAVEGDLRKRAGEQYYVQWKTEIMLMLLVLLSSLSSSFCGEASGLFMPGRSRLQLPTESHSRSRATQACLGLQHVLSQSVRRYSCSGLFPLPGPPAHLCISLPTLENLGGGHLLFLPSPYPLPSPPAPFC